MVGLPADPEPPLADAPCLSGCSDSFFRDFPPNNPLKNPLSFFTTTAPPAVVPVLLLPPELAGLTLLGAPAASPLSASADFCLSFPFPFLFFELVETADERPSLTHARFFSLPSFEPAGTEAGGGGIAPAAGFDRFGLV